MPSANVMQLRALLAEKFPGVRMRVDQPRAEEYKFQPSGLPQIDEPLHGGFPKGALSEVVVAGANAGSSTLIRSLLDHAARANEIVALIDGNDSFNATQLEENVLARLLWVRCHAAAEAVKAADLVLRDGNLPLVLLDLKLNPDGQLRKISPATWYRFQRLVEVTAAVCIVVTPRRMLAPARARIHLCSHFSLAALEDAAGEILGGLKMDVSESRQYVETEFPQIQA